MICKMREGDSRSKDPKGEIQPWQRHKTPRKKHGRNGNWAMSSISLLSCSNTGNHFPTHVCWKGCSSFPVGVVNVSTLACAEQPEAWLLQHMSHSPTPLPWLHCFHFAVKLIPVSSSSFMLTQREKGVVQEKFLSARQWVICTDLHGVNRLYT